MLSSRQAMPTPKHRTGNSLETNLSYLPGLTLHFLLQLLGACMRKGDFRIVTEVGECINEEVAWLTYNRRIDDHQKLDGDLEGLIHDTEKQLSLFTRMCMARDIALGMNWLHNTKPAIIHRYYGLPQSAPEPP